MIHIPFSRTVTTYIKEKQQEKRNAQSDWIFSPERWQMIKGEGQDWKDRYLPVNLKGRIVLDIGAGEGETARLFIEHGAKKVYCIECNPKRIQQLYINQQLHSQIEVLPQKFSPYMLQLEHDFLKMDIEGYEQILLDENIVLQQPSVLEIHGLQLKDRFQAAGYKIVPHYGCDYWTCYGYWRC